MPAMNPRPWYVITGGPCAGKTSLIEELRRRGYEVVPEAARAYIEANLAAGKTINDIRGDAAAFQRALIPVKEHAEAKLSPESTIFFDRGMHDSIVYLERAGVTDDPTLAAALAKTSYAKAFLLDLLPFETDQARTETAEEVQQIHEALGKAYESAGIRVERVPALSVTERADFILSHL